MAMDFRVGVNLCPLHLIRADIGLNNIDVDKSLSDKRERTTKLTMANQK